MSNVFKIEKTYNLKSAKKIVCSNLDTTIMIFNKYHIITNNHKSVANPLQGKQKDILYLLNLIIYKKVLNKILLRLSYYINNEKNKDKEYFMLIKNKKNIDIYSYYTHKYNNNNNNINMCTLEWTTDIGKHHYKNDLKKNNKLNPTFIFTTHHIPSIIGQFTNSSISNNINVIYVHIEDRKNTHPLDISHLNNSLPTNSKIAVLLYY
uniref:Uncharacterized protein n=1 Tax=Trachysalambria curvirostris majanivirus TaxID=2984281 RepID=A0A9C7EYX9_9VIRU|nr:MAG: hypothetical protein [Trachysalambria curvirostris majanivirus]